MNPSERNPNDFPNDMPDGAHGGQDDDDFGDFEGFEGGVERLQAQPAPSPWATFPDLLPVQTSPATPAEESQSSARAASALVREAWHPVVGAVSWRGPPDPGEEPGQVVQPMRTLNPPDVSLGTNQGAGGRITPDNVHDAAHGMNHGGGNMPDARLPVAQLDLLQQQLGDAEQHRVALEEQVDQLRQRNVELELQLASSQAQIQELQTRLQQNQDALEQRLTEMREVNSMDWRQDLRQLQEEVTSIKDAQTAERSDLQVVRQQMEEVKSEICSKLQNLESNIQREYADMEHRLFNRFGEECRQMQNAIENIVQQCSQQFSGTFSQLVLDTLQKNSDCGPHPENNLMQLIKAELERHEEHQKRVLEEERRQQLLTVSSALQSALQHLTCAINNSPKTGEDIS